MSVTLSSAAAVSPASRVFNSVAFCSVSSGAAMVGVYNASLSEWCAGCQGKRGDRSSGAQNMPAASKAQHLSFRPCARTAHPQGPCSSTLSAPCVHRKLGSLLGCWRSRNSRMQSTFAGSALSVSCGRACLACMVPRSACGGGPPACARRRLIRHEAALAATLLQCKSSVAAFKAAPSSSAAGRTAVHVVAQKRVSKKQQVGAAGAAAAGLGGSAVGQAA